MSRLPSVVTLDTSFDPFLRRRCVHAERALSTHAAYRRGIDASRIREAAPDGPAGPDEDVLTGQFGAVDVTMELLATHAGLEISLGCGDYFVSDRAAELDDDGRFAVDGEFHYRAPPPGRSVEGSISGFLAPGLAGGSVTLTFGEGGSAVDPLVVTLRRGEHYEGLPLLCPA